MGLSGRFCLERLKMKRTFPLVILALAGIMLVVAGCSSVNLWPFGESKTSDGPRGPKDATEYRCVGGKTFHIRYLDGGNSVWVIFPDRQVNLNKVTAESGTRYSNGIAILKIDGAEAALTDGPSISYVGCKTPVAGNNQ